MLKRLLRVIVSSGKGSGWLHQELESFICGFQSETSPKLLDNYTHLLVMAEPICANFLGDEQFRLSPWAPTPLHLC